MPRIRWWALVVALVLAVLLVVPRTKVSSKLPSFLDNCLPARYLRASTGTLEELKLVAILLPMLDLPADRPLQQLICTLSGEEAGCFVCPLSSAQGFADGPQLGHHRQ